MENIKPLHESIWESSLLMLKKTLPSHAVGAWFEPIMPKEMRGNVIKLEVPNAFFCDWIDSHYKQQLIEAINNHHEEKIYYEFVVSSKGSQASPATLSSNPAPRKKQTFMSKNNINSQYRFDNFIEGSNNEFAKNAAKAVSENPGSNNFNPP